MLKKRRANLTEFDLEILYACVEDGKTDEEIAEILGCSKITVQMRRIKKGIRRDCDIAISNKDKEIIYNMAKRGETISSIARATGLNASTIFYIIKRVGLYEEGLADRAFRDGERFYRINFNYNKWISELIKEASDYLGISPKVFRKNLGNKKYENILIAFSKIFIPKGEATDYFEEKDI